jgi:hypothetical protein
MPTKPTMITMRKIETKISSASEIEAPPRKMVPTKRE